MICGVGLDLVVLVEILYKGLGFNKVLSEYHVGCELFASDVMIL